jgi:hypothetical protein
MTMDELCRRFAGFFHYAKILEMVAAGIQSGAIKVPQVSPGVADEHRALPHRLSDSLPLKHQRARQTNVMAARGPVEIPPEATPEPLLRQRR